MSQFASVVPIQFDDSTPSPQGGVVVAGGLGRFRALMPMHQSENTFGSFSFVTASRKIVSS